MSVTILGTTTKNPITLIGERAGVCYHSDITDPEKNYKRGLDCIKSGHGRALEFVNIEMVLSNYSSRVIREWYTHLGGAPTRLQESTRYVKYGAFDFYTPPTIAEKHQEEVYNGVMVSIAEGYKALLDAGIPKEDAANVLPLGLMTTIVDKRNLRNFIDMCHQRLCTRAYKEYRKLMNDIITALCEYSDEWVTLKNMLFVPKCEFLGHCPETNSCGRYKS